jgi:hypothetical protein
LIHRNKHRRAIGYRLPMAAAWPIWDAGQTGGVWNVGARPCRR